jgi:hypothetical protein
MRILVTFCVYAAVAFMLPLPASTGITWPPHPADDVITVCSSGCDHVSIQDGVDAAEPGYTILLGPETFYEIVHVDRDLSIIGAGRDQTVVDGSATGTVFETVATLALENMTVQNGQGGVWSTGRVELDSVIVRDNAGFGVVSILTPGGMAISDSLITGNADYGVAVAYTSSNLIENSTITGNGGGVWNFASYVRIENSTITHNLEAGVYASVFSSSWITNATVAWNDGFGVNAQDSEWSHVSMDRVIVVGNGSSPQCRNLRGPGAGSVNLSTDESCQSTIVTATPLLMPLHDYGGPTPTCALHPDSPAIDASAGCLLTDQRGVLRPVDGNGDTVALCDIGAVEFFPPCDDPASPYACEPGALGRSPVYQDISLPTE